MRRLLLLSGMLVLLVLWGWIVLRPKPQPLGVPTKGNFDLVEVGMTMERVEAILGPSGTHARFITTSRHLFSEDFTPPVPPPDKESMYSRTWVEQDCVFMVKFTLEDGHFKEPRVRSKHYARQPSASTREHIRRLFPWWERCWQ